MISCISYRLGLYTYLYCVLFQVANDSEEDGGGSGGFSGSNGSDSDGQTDEDETADNEQLQLDIDQCLELGQESAHVGDVYEKVIYIVTGFIIITISIGKNYNYYKLLQNRFIFFE